MAVKISHIIIPVKSPEEMRKAGEFFVNVIGLHRRDGFDEGGVPTQADIWKEQDLRKPDRVLHLLDDYDTFIDIVYYKDRVVSYAKGVGRNKGVCVAIRVPDLKQAWSKLKDYPVTPVFDPGKYSEKTEPIIMEGKEPWLGDSFAFCALNMGRVSEHGEEQPIEIV